MAESTEERDERPWCIRYITAIARLCGFATLAVLWVASLIIVQDHENSGFIGWYLLAAAILVTLFEALWVIDKLICCSRTGTCCTLWKGCLWIDKWRKTILYILLSVPCYIQEFSVTLSIAGGILLDVTAIVYMLIACQNCPCIKPKRNPDETSDKSQLVSRDVQTDAEAETYKDFDESKDTTHETEDVGSEAMTLSKTTQTSYQTMTTQEAQAVQLQTKDSEPSRKKRTRPNNEY